MITLHPPPHPHAITPPPSLPVAMRDPENDTVLIEGVLFRARYLGSTTLISEGQPSKPMRMMQAQEAVGRIKVGALMASVLVCFCWEGRFSGCVVSPPPMGVINLISEG